MTIHLHSESTEAQLCERTGCFNILILYWRDDCDARTLMLTRHYKKKRPGHYYKWLVAWIFVWKPRSTVLCYLPTVKDLHSFICGTLVVSSEEYSHMNSICHLYGRKRRDKSHCSQFPLNTINNPKTRHSAFCAMWIHYIHYITPILLLWVRDMHMHIWTKWCHCRKNVKQTKLQQRQH